MAQVVYAEPTDELASLLQKLEAVQDEDVVLLVPKGTTALEDPLSWSLLVRQARHLGKGVIVVTRDREARYGARLAGFPVYRSLRRLRLKPNPGQTASLAPFLRRGRGSGLPVALGSVGLGMLLFLALGAYLVVPTGAVTLRPLVQEMALTLSIKATQQVRIIDVSAAQIPARLLQAPLEGIETGDNTGRKSIPGKARGEVTFLNRSPSRQVVPASTPLLASQAIQFLTLEQADLPPGGTARARVVASSPGPSGNLPSMAIDRVAGGPYASSLAVWNELPTYGGVEEDIAVVSAQDQSNLRSRLRGKLAKEGQDRLQALKAESESIYPTTVFFSPMEEVFDKEVGTEAPSLTLRMRGSVSGLAFDGKDVNLLAQKSLESQALPGYHLLPRTLDVVPLEAYDWGEGWVDFRVMVKAKASAVVEGDKVGESLRGKNPTEALEYLKVFPQREPLALTVKPIWLDWVPIYLWRVEVRY